MKILWMTLLFALSFFSLSCQRDGDVIQREEEMDRGDIVEDGIDQRDIHPANRPSNVGK